MSQARYIESSAAIRYKLLALVLLGVLLNFGFVVWIKPLLQWAATLPTCESLPWLRMELLIAVLVVWAFSAVAFGRAKRTWQLQQTPLPDSWVWTRTKVKTGVHAKMTAAALYLISATALVSPLIVIAGQKLYLLFCWPHSCGC